MDSEELVHYIKFIVGSDYHFEVISAADLELVQFKKDKDTFLVVHVPIESATYGHFITFEVSCLAPTAKYFDSFGLDVYNYLNHVPFAIVSENDRALQDKDSCMCGLYCLFFIYHRSRSHLYQFEILSLFVNDTKENDKKVSKLFDQLNRQMPNRGRLVHYKLLKCTFMSTLLAKLKNDFRR